MALQTKYKLTHKVRNGTTTDTYTIKILKEGWSGGTTNIKASKSKGVARLITEKLDPLEPFANPLQKTSLDLFMIIKGQGVDPQLGYDGRAIIDEILAGNERDFQIRYFVNGNEQYRGWVLPDLMEWTGGQKVFDTKIQAKDLTVLETEDFELVDGVTNTPIIKIMSECLLKTGLDLPIRTFTNITADIPGVNDADDFLNQFYHKKEHFRDRGGNDPDEAISCFDVLTEICEKYNLILRQGDARWTIIQLPAVAKGDAVQFDYDKNGNSISAGTPAEDFNVDRTTNFDLPNSLNRISRAIKKIEHTYNHQTQILPFNLPNSVVVENQADFKRIRSEDFAMDGSFQLDLSGDFDILTDNTSGQFIDITVFYQIIYTGEFEDEDGNVVKLERFYNDENDNWQSSPFTIESQAVGSGQTISGSIAPISTPTAPLFEKDVSGENGNPIGTTEIIDGHFEIQFQWGQVSGATIEEITYKDWSGRIFSSENTVRNASIDFKYTQDGNFSVVDEMGNSRIGQGPTSVSPGAVYRLHLGVFKTIEDRFNIRGVTELLSLEELLMRERMNMQRVYLRSAEFNLKGSYSQSNTISFQNKRWFTLGGEFTIAEANHIISIMELFHVADNDDTDTFGVIPKDGSGGGSVSSGSSSNNTFWSNINDKPFETVGGTLTVINDTLQLPQSLKETDTPTFAGLNIGNDPVWHPGNFDPSTKADTGHTHDLVTPTVPGFMSNTDKSKLDGIQSGAEQNVVTKVFGRTGDVVPKAGDYDWGEIQSGFGTNLEVISGKLRVMDAPTFSGAVTASSIDIANNSDANRFRINGVPVIDEFKNIKNVGTGQFSGNVSANDFVLSGSGVPSGDQDIVMETGTVLTHKSNLGVTIIQSNGLINPDAIEGGVVASVEWVDVLNKPTAFNPTAHTHNASDITAGTIDNARLPQSISPTDTPEFAGLDLNGNLTSNSGWLWVKSGTSWLEGGAVVGSSATPTYDFEILKELVAGIPEVVGLEYGCLTPMPINSLWGMLQLTQTLLRGNK